MRERYVIYVHTSPHFEPTELFVFADSPDDALDTVTHMVKQLGGDIGKAHDVTVNVD